MRFISILAILIGCLCPTFAAVVGSPTPGATDNEIVNSTTTGVDTYWLGPQSTPWFVSYSGTASGTPVATTIGTGLQLSSGVLSCTVSPGTKTFNAPVTRALDTAFQISATQDAYVAYPVEIRVQSLLLGNAAGWVYLDYADNSGMSTNLKTFGPFKNTTSGVLSLDNTGTVTLTGVIPAAKYVRLRTATQSGTVSYASQPGQEVLQ